jgi:hypothetical protein
MHKEIESILGTDRLIKSGDPTPSIVVLAMLVMRHLPSSEFEILLVEEKKNDALKEAGVVSWAGAETAKVINRRVEGLQSNILGALSEEILAGVPEEQDVGINYTYLGDFWYLPRVLAHLVSVRFDQMMPDEYIRSGDGETSDPFWMHERNLRQILWRHGMEGSPDLLPRIAVCDFMKWQTKNDGQGWDRVIINGSTLREFRNTRAQFPDTKHTDFNWG